MLNFIERMIILNEKVEMIRGDTLKLKFSRQTEKEEIIKEPVDEMFMTFKENIYTRNFVFQKCLQKGSIFYEESTGYYHVTIEPKDTEHLRYGDYFFDIEIKMNDIVKTIAKGILTLKEEVTFACNKETL